MRSHMDRRMVRVEQQTAELLSYQECGQITCQALTFMRDAMVKNLDDSSLVAGILDEMTGHANELLKPIGFAIGWRP
jgi:hypothetical protein